MSRIGNRLLALAEGVTLSVQANNLVEVKGPKGTLTRTFAPSIKIEVQDNQVKTTRANDLKQTKQLHGTTNSLLKGMIEGVSQGFTKELEIIGVGYRATADGTGVKLALGFSHPVNYAAPEGVKIEVVSQTELKLSGIDKQAVNQAAAEIRAFRKPEPYKGKGVRYKGEYVRRKEGKTAKK